VKSNRRRAVGPVLNRIRIRRHYERLAARIERDLVEARVIRLPACFAATRSMKENTPK
jgi:hypothetical protein